MADNRPAEPEPESDTESYTTTADSDMQELEAVRTPTALHNLLPPELGAVQTPAALPGPMPQELGAAPAPTAPLLLELGAAQTPAALQTTTPHLTVPDGTYRAHPVKIQEDATPHLIRALEALTASTQQGRRQSLPTPVYDGTTDVQQYFRDFETVSHHNGWTEEEMGLRLRLSLKGDASRLECFGGYPEVRRQLLSQYRVTEEKALALLKKLKWQPDQVHALANQIMRLVRLGYPYLIENQQEELGKNAMISLLPGEAPAVMALKLQPPRTMADCVETIQRFQAIPSRVNEIQVQTDPLVAKLTEAVTAIAKQQETLANRQQELLQKLEKPPARVNGPKPRPPRPPYLFPLPANRPHSPVLPGQERSAGGKRPSPEPTPPPVSSGAPTVNLGVKQLNLCPRTEAYYITAKVEGRAQRLLLDSGCTQSILPQALYQQYKEYPSRPVSALRQVRGQGILADGTTVPFLGLTSLTMRLGAANYSHEFLVADVPGHPLLGLDFFEQFGCQLDFGKARFCHGSEEMECCDAEGHALRVNVQVIRKVELPPRSERVIPAQLTQPWARGPVCVEPKEAVPGAMVATSVDEPRGRQVYLRILNYTSEVVTIPAGKVVATCCGAQVLDTSPRVGNCLRKGVPLTEPLQQLLDNCGENFHPTDQAKIRALLEKHQEVFSLHKFDLGRTHAVQHDIPLQPGARPLKQRPYRHGPAQELEIEEQVQELKEHGLITAGKGAWSSPVVLVKKKNGSWRFCVDYRKLNELTCKDAYPLPRIDDSLDALGGSRLFSTLDLTSGYWQVGLAPDAKEKAAFSTRSGLWEWEVLPFGLTSAPSTFERLMETVLRGLHWKTVLIYLDDIIVFAPDLDSHLERLGEVFTRLTQAGLKLKPEKCTLLQDKVKYLGHVVSARGIETDPEKTDAIDSWPVPRHKKDVRSFLGTCGYYRRFIVGYSEISRPLSQVASKDATFAWTPECQAAFDQLRRALTSAPILAYPQYDLPFILDTDASAVGAGAILSQVQNGEERVIAYYSKMLSREERNYCVTRRELVAIVKALKHFRPHLYGKEFMVRTDHASLAWLLRIPHPTGQLARWIEAMADYKFELVHRKGRVHNNVDGLSRRTCLDCKQCKRMTHSEEATASSDAPVGVQLALGPSRHTAAWTAVLPSRVRTPETKTDPTVTGTDPVDQNPPPPRPNPFPGTDPGDQN